MEDMKLKLPKPTVDLDEIRQALSRQSKGKAQDAQGKAPQRLAHAGSQPTPPGSASRAARWRADGARANTAIWLLASGGTLLDGFSIFSLGVAMPLRHAADSTAQPADGRADRLGAGSGRGVWRGIRRSGRRPVRPQAASDGRHGDPRRRRVHQRLRGAPHWILLGQFLVGIGIGIDFPVSASYVSETMPKSARSRMMVATIALQSVGMLVGAAVALDDCCGYGAAADWRLIVGATGAGALSVLLLRLWLAGKSALADGAWPRPGSGAHRRQSSRPTDGAAASCSRRRRQSRRRSGPRFRRAVLAAAIARGRCWYRCRGF